MVNVFSALIIQQRAARVETYQKGEYYGYSILSECVEGPGGGPGEVFRSSPIYLSSEDALADGQRVVGETRNLDLTQSLEMLAVLSS